MPAPTYNYMGTWNASSGSAPPTSNVGDVYLVSTAGTTTATPGISVWYAGDQAVFLGTTWHKLNGVNRDVPSVLDWGADPTGASDSTSAIQSAVDFVVAAGGGDLLFPVGNYKHSGLTINSSGAADAGYIRLIGLGNNSLPTTTAPPSIRGVRLICSSTTADHLFINNCNSVEIDGFEFLQTLTPTAGWGIHTLNGEGLTLRNFFISGAFNGLLIDGTDTPVVENGDIEDLSGTSGLTVRGTNNPITQGRFDRLFIRPGTKTSPPTTCNGVTVADNVSSITWIKISVNWAVFGLILGTFTDDATKTPSFHRFYDFAVENCATGVYLRNASQCWFTDLYAGLSDNAGVNVGQTMDQQDSNSVPYGGPIYFESPEINGNGTHGVELLGSPLISFKGGVIGGNSLSNPDNYDGINVISPTAYFSVIGTRIGGNTLSQPSIIGNQRYGIYITSDVTAPSFVIDDVNALGNQTGALYDASAATPKKVIGTIVGFNKFATSLPNVLVNGAFQIWQRGTSFSFGSPTPCADYWVCARAAYTLGGALSLQTGGPSGSRYYARLQRMSADTSPNLLYLVQVLTTADSLPFAGQQVVLSFYARMGSDFSGGTLASQIVLGTGTDQTATLVVLAGWTNQSGYGQSNTLTTSWQLFTQALNVPPTLSGNATSQIAIELYYTPTGTAGTNDYVDIGLVSLQTDYGPPVTEIRPYWLELLASERRFRKSFSMATAPAQNTGVPAGAAYVRLSTGQSGVFGVEVPLTPPMRAAPTVITYNPSAANAKWRDATNGADRTVTVGDVADSGFRVDGAAGVAGSANYVHWTADAELT